MKKTVGIMKLTNLQQAMLEKLNKVNLIEWAYTTSIETKVLNQLVNKGFAVFDVKEKVWKIKKPVDSESEVK